MGIEHIQFIRGTAEAMVQVNPLLLAGELGLETDTGKYKIGDGVTAWNSLNYSGLRVPSGDSVYVVKGGSYVPALLVEKPSEWTPTIDDADIVITVDEDMKPYQLAGNNVAVNIEESEGN